MAKGQKRSSREPRKPKQDKPKLAAAPNSLSEPADRRGWLASSRTKGPGR